MYSRVNYTLIGLFVMIFTLGIVFFALWLDNNTFKDDTTAYILPMRQSISGLSKDSSVKLKGVDIGTVSDICINPNNIEEIEIVLNIKKSVPIKEDMRGVVKMFGLTGLSYVEIEGGSNEAKRLTAQGGAMPVIKSKGSFMSNIEKKVDDISEKLSKVLESSELVLSPKNIKNFSALLENSNQVAIKGVTVEDKIILSLDETTQTMREFVEQFTTLSTNYNRLAVNLDREMKPLIESFEKSAKSVEDVANSIEKTVNRGDYNLQKIMQPSMDDIRELTAQLRALTRELRASPSDILYKSRKPMKGPGE